MQPASAGEGHLQRRRLASGVRLGLILLAGAACLLTAVSIDSDRRTTIRLARQIDSDMSSALAALADNVLDQAYYSLAGIAADVPRAESAEQFMSRYAPATLRTAAQFDPVSLYLFARGAGQQVVVDPVGEPTGVADETIAALPAPPRPHEPFLSVPVQGRSPDYLVPLQLMVAAARDGQSVVLGALVPVSKFAAAQKALGERERSGQALYLRDGRLLMRSVGQERFIGGMAPESAAIVERSHMQASADFEALSGIGEPMSGHYMMSGRYPFIAASGQTVDIYLAPWRMRSYGKGALLVLFILLLGLAGRMLLRTLASLSASGALHRRVFEDVADGLVVFSPDATVRDISGAALRIIGASSPALALGRNLFELLPRSVDPRTGQPTTRATDRIERALQGERQRFEYSFESPLSHQHVDCEIHLSTFEADGERLLLLVMRDITAERRHMREQEFLANHDPLTGLPNRYNLVRTLDRRIDAAPDAGFDLVLVNLLRFKEINESFGHRKGDTLLEVVAQRLAKAMAERGWMLARLGGTDLVALPEREEGTAAAAEAMGSLVLQVLAEPVGAEGETVELRAILGSTRYPEDALDAGQLLRCAEIAARHAKATGRASVRYDKEFDRSPGHDLKMRTDLRAAIRLGQLQLAFQPKVALEDRSLVGAEALLRWSHPKLGWIPPNEFIPLAESTELIHPLTRWVVGEALDRIAAWRLAGQPLKLAVNISVNNLQDPDFCDFVKDLLRRKELPAELLELEVTEGALARNPEIVLRRLQDLRAAGISLSLDDFGTGFSSLSYVSQFPFTSVKIDRSFVSALLGSPRDRQVAESTIELGHKLGLQTIAEGVEDDATAAALLALDCEVGQGYLFSKPLLLPEFEQWRSQHEARLAEARRRAAVRHRA